MKKNLFLYLFVFAGLIALYLAVTGNKTSKKYAAELKAVQNQKETLEDSIQALQFRVMDLQYFSLENNDDALAYYDDLGLNDPSRYIADKLLETNEQKGDNPLIPYAGMESAFKINKISVLNHKWIHADFSDGKYWGELLIHYELKDDLSVDFTPLDHLLYTSNL